MNKKQINEFLKRLEGPEGCNFKETKKGDPESITWSCKGGTNKDLSVKILTAMKISPSKQAEFLTLCTLHGGHCDCEIIFNAAKHLIKDKKEKKC